MPDGDYRTMCDNVKRRFGEVVDFDRDAEKVKQFLDEIK